MKILHVVSGVGRRSFGLGTVVLNLAHSQLAQNHDVQIWCLDDPDEVAWAMQVGNLPSGCITGFPSCLPARLGYSLKMQWAVHTTSGQDFDVLHQHGIWTGLSLATTRWRSLYHKPTVIAAHGSLDPWALKRSRWRKRMAALAYERQNLRRASCLHALSENEASGFRDFGLTNPVAIIPNGIADEWITQTADAEMFRRQFGISKNIRLMLFLGRITPKKGLPLLIEAMARLRDQLGDWKLIIAGADEFGHQAEIQAIIASLDLTEHVQFVGPVFEDLKRSAFAAADLFVLTSHSEGAPMTILEALGAGVPVLTTRASPWQELSTYDCGWWVDTSVESIVDALQDALGLPQTALRAMGQRGKALVKQRYTWSQIAQQTLLLYDWLLGRGEQPGFVVTS